MNFSKGTLSQVWLCLNFLLVSPVTQTQTMKKTKKIEFQKIPGIADFTLLFCGPGSVVGIATAYGMDGQGIEFRWRWDFPHLSRPALRPNQPPVNGYRVFPGVKVRPERDADPSPPSSTEVKNRVELYLYCPYGPSEPMIGWNLHTFLF